MHGTGEPPLTVSKDDDVIRLDGELCYESGDRLLGALADDIEADDDLRIDLSGVTFMDLAGLRFLLRAVRLRGPTAPVVLRSPPPQVVRLMEATHAFEAHPGLRLEESS
jgi:anti-anti-sigma factor